MDGVNKLLGKETNPVHDLDVALGRLAKADLSAADKIALALKLRSYADWLDAATPRAASPAALVSTPAQDGFRYRFEGIEVGDAVTGATITGNAISNVSFGYGIYFGGTPGADPCCGASYMTATASHGAPTAHHPRARRRRNCV